MISVIIQIFQGGSIKKTRFETFFSKYMNFQKGQAALLIIFVLGMISLTVGMSQIKLGTLESFRGRGSANSLQAYYAANSGIEDAIHRIENGDTPNPNLTVNGHAVKIKVTDNGGPDNKIIESVAKAGNYVRRIKVEVNKSLGFNYAIEADNGGIDLETNTHITINPLFTGSADVWSNSYLFGTSKKDTGSGISEINGTAYAVEQISCPGKVDKNCGVNIGNSAWSSNLIACNVMDSKYSENTPDTNCGGTSNWISSDIGLPLKTRSLPTVDLTKPLVSVGPCTMSDTNPDCGSGNFRLGNITIDGDLIINTSKTNKIEITGTVYVKGNVILQNGKIGLISDPNSANFLDNQKVIAEGVIDSYANVDFGGNEKGGKAAFLTFYSTQLSPSGPSDICDLNIWKKVSGIDTLVEINNAISLSSNTNSVLFYATNGCVLIKQHANFYGAVLGKKVKMAQNSYIYYDPRLGGDSSKNNWRMSSFEEY